jgi:peptidoglycan/xylan/chitin deacetylase (PgdA/CDA1 family)
VSDTLVLCYHAVSNGWPSQLSVTPAALERQLAILVGRGYRGVTFSEAVQGGPGGRTVSVTFDDSFRSVIELARPVLRELGVPGTVFVPTSFVGSDRPMRWAGITSWLGGPNESELIPMSWDELGELASEGWEIGSHTRTHPRLPLLDGEALREELAGSRAELEEGLGGRCRSIAYPYGDCSATVVMAAREAGYVGGGAMAGRVVKPAALEWPRVPVFLADDERRYRLKVARPMRWLRSTGLWRARLRVRGRL